MNSTLSQITAGVPEVTPEGHVLCSPSITGYAHSKDSAAQFDEIAALTKMGDLLQEYRICLSVDDQTKGKEDKLALLIDQLETLEKIASFSDGQVRIRALLNQGTAENIDKMILNIYRILIGYLCLSVCESIERNYSPEIEQAYSQTQTLSNTIVKLEELDKKFPGLKIPLRVTVPPEHKEFVTQRDDESVKIISKKLINNIMRTSILLSGMINSKLGPIKSLTSYLDHMDVAKFSERIEDVINVITSIQAANDHWVEYWKGEVCTFSSSTHPIFFSALGVCTATENLGSGFSYEITTGNRGAEEVEILVNIEAIMAIAKRVGVQRNALTALYSHGITPESIREMGRVLHEKVLILKESEEVRSIASLYGILCTANSLTLNLAHGVSLIRQTTNVIEQVVSDIVGTTDEPSAQEE